jgi:hypothetical protein
MELPSCTAPNLTKTQVSIVILWIEKYVAGLKKQKETQF